MKPSNVCRKMKTHKPRKKSKARKNQRHEGTQAREAGMT